MTSEEEEEEEEGGVIYGAIRSVSLPRMVIKLWRGSCKSGNVVRGGEERIESKFGYGLALSRAEVELGVTGEPTTTAPPAAFIAGPHFRRCLNKTSLWDEAHDENSPSGCTLYLRPSCVSLVAVFALEWFGFSMLMINVSASQPNRKSVAADTYSTLVPM